MAHCQARGGLSTCLQPWLGNRDQPGSILLEILPCSATQFYGKLNPPSGRYCNQTVFLPLGVNDVRCRICPIKGTSLTHPSPHQYSNQKPKQAKNTALNCRTLHSNTELTRKAIALRVVHQTQKTAGEGAQFKIIGENNADHFLLSRSRSPQ